MSTIHNPTHETLTKKCKHCLIGEQVEEELCVECLTYPSRWEEHSRAGH